jgi:hypothetical protein
MSREMNRDTFCVTDGQTDTFCVTEELGILVVECLNSHSLLSFPKKPGSFSQDFIQGGNPQHSVDFSSIIRNKMRLLKKKTHFMSTLIIC